MKVDAITGQLQRVYAEYPSLKLNTDVEALRTAAERVLGKPAADALAKAALEAKDTFLQARADALLRLTGESNGEPPRRTAVVSGLSAGGLVAAAILAKAGYRVEAFEQRASYSRNIIFSARQALIDELATIDPKLAERFLELATGFEHGFKLVLNDKPPKVIERPAPEGGDPMRVPDSGEAMLEAPPAALVEAKLFERLLFEYLKGLPNVTIHTGSVIELTGPDEKGSYEVGYKPRGSSDPSQVTPLGTPDLVVLSEGANSATRRALGIHTVPTSPPGRFIAGRVHAGAGPGGRYVTRDLPREDGTKDRVVAVALRQAGENRPTWLIAGVPKDLAFDPVGESGLPLDPTSGGFKEAQQAMVEQYYRQTAALVMELDVDTAQKAVLEGAIEGLPPTVFTAQQQLAETAVAGTNVIGLGDFVGTGMFTVGGGMMTAAVAHPERLKGLLLDLELGVDKAAALARYEQGVMEDTVAWGRRGMPDFFPDFDRKLLSDAFVQAVAEWKSGSAPNPLQALETILAAHSKALEPIGAPKAA